MRNEIISEDVQKCQNILCFTFLIDITISSGATEDLSQGSELR